MLLDSQAAMDFVVEEDLKAHLTCWYIQKYVKENPQPQYFEHIYQWRCIKRDAQTKTSRGETFQPPLELQQRTFKALLTRHWVYSETMPMAILLWNECQVEWCVMSTAYRCTHQETESESVGNVVRWNQLKQTGRNFSIIKGCISRSRWLSGVCLPVMIQVESVLSSLNAKWHGLFCLDPF